MAESEIIVKVRKLIEQEKGERAVGNSAAAALFAEKVQELCIKYKLERAEVEGVDPSVDDPIGNFYVWPQDHGYKPLWRRSEWQERLANIVAWAHFCKICVAPGSNFITFTGRQSDREIAAYMFVYLLRKCEELAEAEYREARREGKRTQDFKASFREAFRRGVANRYKEKRQEVEDRLQREAQRSADDGPCAALIVLRDAEQAVVDWLTANVKGTAKELNGREGWNGAGWRAGLEHGRNVSLNANAIKTRTQKALSE